MKNEIGALVIALAIFCSSHSLVADNNSLQRGALLAQGTSSPKDFLDDEEDQADDGAQRKLQEPPKSEEEARQRDEAKRSAIRRQQLKERKMAEAKAQELAGIREASLDATEYTLDPNSVELVVEMDPHGLGLRTRNHRMTLSADFDLILRGRTMLHYDYRFWNFFSAGALLGMDVSDMSIYTRLRDHLPRTPKQISILGGVSAKWRVTEWFMRSSLFLEPSFLFGHMWQRLDNQKTTHWRLRPGIFVGFESIFDSGLSISTRLGMEFPFDFGMVNPVREIVEPLLLVGVGFAI